MQSWSQRLAVLAVSLAVISTGCGGGGGGGGTGGGAAPGATTTATDAAAVTTQNPPVAPVGQPPPAANPVTPAGPAAPTATPTPVAVAPTPVAGPTPGPTPTPPITVTPPSPLDDQLRSALANSGVGPVPVVPTNPARVALGQALFFDKLLSGNKDIACATCHHPLEHTTDGLSLSIGTGGVGRGPTRQLAPGHSFIPRNAPDLFNRAVFQVLFWDGRVAGPPGNLSTPAGGQLPAGVANALAAQSLFPITARDEMRGELGDTAVDGSPNELAAIADTDFASIWNAIMARLLANPQYVALFQAAYPGVPANQLGIQHVGNAIAEFEVDEWTELDSAFDRYLVGDNAALTDNQKQGALLFYGRARCDQCHRGGLMTDFAFHDIAFPQIGPGKGDEAPLDFGRGRETGAVADRFKFRTPPLRNVAVTGPWGHAGGYTTLNAVVRHYINPGNALQNYNPNQLDPRLRNMVHNQELLNAGVLTNLDPILRGGIPLNNNEVAQIVDFLGALTTTDTQNAANEVPASVPSGLPVDQ